MVTIMEGLSLRKDVHHNSVENRFTRGKIFHYHNQLWFHLIFSQFGNGLPTLDTDVATLEAMRSVGFEIVESEDIALTSEVPWETPLEPGLMNFKATPLGRTATHSMLFCLEKLGLSPKGSTKVHSVLCKGADALIKGAKSEIFTPMFYVLARKPVESKWHSYLHVQEST